MVDVPDKKGVRWLRTGLFGPTASERAEAAEARARRAEENDALDQIASIAGSSPQLGEVGRLIGDQVRRLAPFDHMSVIFLDSEGDTYTQTFAVGLEVPDEGPSEASWSMLDPLDPGLALVSLEGQCHGIV